METKPIATQMWDHTEKTQTGRYTIWKLQRKEPSWYLIYFDLLFFFFNQIMRKYKHFLLLWKCSFLLRLSPRAEIVFHFKICSALIGCRAMWSFQLEDFLGGRLWVRAQSIPCAVTYVSVHLQRWGDLEWPNWPLPFVINTQNFPWGQRDHRHHRERFLFLHFLPW